MRYELRYTNDLYVIDVSDDLESLVRKSDYKIHVFDTMTRTVVWQSSKSERFGSVGVR